MDKDKIREQKAAWDLKNKGHIMEYCAAYRAAHRETLRKRCAAWYSENKDKSREHTIKWYSDHPGKKKEHDAKYYEEHKEQINMRVAAYRKEHLEEARAYGAAWHAAHPGRKAARYALDPSKQKIDEHNRRARKKSCGGKLSKEVVPKLLTFQRHKCAVCNISLKKIGYHVDHIVPLIKGGPNEDRNIQLTCPSCNSRKSAKDPIQFMQEMGYLL